jgi:hypothetical protein
MKKQIVFKVMIFIGSIITIGFGVWHFPIPAVYDWYGHIQDETGELALAVQAINFFFSLCLVLFGIQTMLYMIKRWKDAFTMKVQLFILSVLWLSRVVMQIVYPQGTMMEGLSIIMLVVFIFTLLCFLIPAVFASHKPI